MKKAKHCLAWLLAAVFALIAVPAAYAEDAPIPGGSVPVRTHAGATITEVTKRLDLVDAWVGADAESADALPGSSIVATGMVIHAEGRDTPIVVPGDVLGTGVISISQLARLAKALTGAAPLEGEFLIAGDLNENGIIDIADLSMLATFLLTGVMPSAQAPQMPASDVMEIVNTVQSPLQNPWDNRDDPSAHEAAEGANDFAFRFSSALMAGRDNQNDNFVCSPYSVWLPLAALVNATDEASRPELLEAIGAAGLSPQDVNRAASRMLYGLTAVQQNAWLQNEDLPAVDPLKIANAIFVDRTKTVSQEFAQIFASDYLGDCILTDFSSQEAIDAINQWCSDNTEGLIEKIVEEFGPDTVAAIANAIYFSDRWEHEFLPENTRDSVFHTPSGDVTVPFMSRKGYDMSYYEDDDIQAVNLSFRTDGGMTILLPKDGNAEELLTSLTEDRFSEIRREAAGGRDGKLLLPRFEIDSGVMDLRESLEALGVPLFEDAVITKLLDDSDPLYISQAVQNAMIQVDEKGTTAAAVTVMAVDATGAFVPGEPFEMNCDHPFVFVLHGNTYDAGAQVLFTGIVNQPTAHTTAQ